VEQRRKPGPILTLHGVVFDIFILAPLRRREWPAQDENILIFKKILIYRICKSVHISRHPNDDGFLWRRAQYFQLSFRPPRRDP
jgi:hypothetical protein